ncbi:MAG TPA: TetR/AcrR family transcriptional regulator [Micromonosporaceae bacterium]|nr:TetR/AcrR family transcriptional regulator [Micromonosporaceae bacterium]
MRSYGGQTVEQRRAQRRERLIAAALDLFGTEGYQAVSIEKLCAAAGVSTRNFYQEFTGREELLTAVHGLITAEAVGAVGTVLSEMEDEPLAKRIGAAVTEYIRVTAEDPRRAKVAYVEVVGVSHAVEEHRLAWRETWSQLMEAEAQRAMARGEASDRDFHLSTVAIMGAVNELVHHWSTRQKGVPLDTVTAELVRLILLLLAGDVENHS